MKVAVVDEAVAGGTESRYDQNGLSSATMNACSTFTSTVTLLSRDKSVRVTMSPMFFCSSPIRYHER